jgi:hypothetical protein
VPGNGGGVGGGHEGGGGMDKLSLKFVHRIGTRITGLGNSRQVFHQAKKESIIGNLIGKMVREL